MVSQEYARVFRNPFSCALKTTIHFFLPDTLATCNPNDISPTSSIVDNPCIIVEILSKTTELSDRSEKWKNYRQIPSLCYYLMVSQKEPLVEVYGRPHVQSLFICKISGGWIQ
jgi:Uma2 family endonuclease